MLRDRTLVSLSDSQLQAVSVAAASLPVEKRSVYLERVAGHLRQQVGITDAAVGAAVKAAMRGLLVTTTA
jgi:hypothetical protein